MSNKVYVSVNGKNVNKVADKLHKQFGHPRANKLIDLINKTGGNNENLINAIHKISNNCVTCKKFKKAPLRPVVSMPMASKLNDAISMDLKIWGAKYFLVIIDLATRYCTAVVINNKNPSTIISNIFLHWIAIFGPPKTILSDNGGEFSNKEMRALGEAFNINIKTTAAQSPWSNGVCERQNAVIGDSVRKIMADAMCSVEVALAWAVAARNSLANNSGFSPNQLVFGQNPGLPNVFSDKLPALNANTPSDLIRNNLNAMHVAREEFIKFESNEKIRRALRHNIRATEAHLIKNGDNIYYKRNGEHEWHGPGVVIGRDGKLFLVRHGGILVRVHECRLLRASNGDARSCSVDSKISEKDVKNDTEKSSQSRVIFEDQCCGGEENKAVVEQVFVEPMSNVGSLNDKDSFEPIRDNPSASEECIASKNERTTKVKVGQRIKGILKDSGELISGKLVSRAGKATGKSRNCFNLQKDSDGDIQWMDFEKDFLEYDVVCNDVEMIVLYNSDKIMEAKQLEIDSWNRNNVYQEVEDEGQETLSVRWVTTEKLKDGKSVIKARLVARGFEENSSELHKHSPTCSKEAVRLTLSIAAANNWACHTIDVKCAFLQGSPIERDIYLKPPSEFDHGKLWKLHKTVYGLSDAARQWYLRVKDELSKLDVQICSLDPALFSWRKNGVIQGIICLYVDDFLWAGENCFQAEVVEKLSDKFLIGKSASNSFKYIGLNIVNTMQGYTTVDQFDYVQTVKPIVISRHRMNNKSSELSEKEKTEYKSLVGQLNWISTQTRPDIAFDVCEMSTLLKKATVSDLIRLNKIISRLTTDNIRLHYPKMLDMNNCSIECFSDASFANLIGDGSQGGFIIFLKDKNGGRCPIYWESRKIKRVVKSTLAAETLALIDCAETAVYISHIMKELCNCVTIPVHCYIDNKSLVDVLESKKNVEDKRLRIDVAVIRDMLQKKEISSIHWVSTNNQLANCLTKRGASAQELRAAVSRD